MGLRKGKVKQWDYNNNNNNSDKYISHSCFSFWLSVDNLLYFIYVSWFMFSLTKFVLPPVPTNLQSFTYYILYFPSPLYPLIGRTLKTFCMSYFFLLTHYFPSSVLVTFFLNKVSFINLLPTLFSLTIFWPASWAVKHLREFSTEFNFFLVQANIKDKKGQLFGILLWIYFSALIKAAYEFFYQ